MNAAAPGAVRTGVTGRLDGVSDPDGAVPSLADEDGVTAAYRLHGAEVYRFALRGLGDPMAAQDVTQETFVKAWRHSDRYDPEVASLRVWLYGIARNTMIDHVRAAAVRPWHSQLAEPPTVEAAAGSISDQADALLDGWLVEEGLRRLAPPPPGGTRADPPARTSLRRGGDGDGHPGRHPAQPGLLRDASPAGRDG